MPSSSSPSSSEMTTKKSHACNDSLFSSSSSASAVPLSSTSSGVNLTAPQCKRLDLSTTSAAPEQTMFGRPTNPLRQEEENQQSQPHLQLHPQEVVAAAAAAATANMARRRISSSPPRKFSNPSVGHVYSSSDVVALKNVPLLSVGRTEAAGSSACTNTIMTVTTTTTTTIATAHLNSSVLNGNVSLQHQNSINQIKGNDHGDGNGNNSSLNIKDKNGNLLPLARTRVVEWGSMKDADAQVNQDMCTLSPEQRADVLADIHGVSEKIYSTNSLGKDDPEETEAVRQQGLKDMTEYITHQIPDVDKQAYLLALSKSEDYVQRDEFRLRFLRTESFDATKAAIRYAKHYQVKLELFGERLLVKDITQDDLGDGDLHNLYSGHSQGISFGDRGGRYVNFFLPRLDVTNGKGHELIHKLRRTFYVSMATSEDINYQRYGFVTVMWFVGPISLASPKAVLRQIEVNQGVPNKIVACHFCYDHERKLPALSSIKLWFDPEVRVRVRAHQGNFLECKHSLQAFGIPPNIMPIGPDGEVSTTQHRIRWEKRRLLERERAGTLMMRMPSNSSSSTSNPIGGAGVSGVGANATSNANGSGSVIIGAGGGIVGRSGGGVGGGSNSSNGGSGGCGLRRISSSSLPPILITDPAPNDVLLGKGRRLQKHAGNIEFRKLIDSYMLSYQRASKYDKTVLTESIVDQVHASSGRFLKRDTSTSASGLSSLGGNVDGVGGTVTAGGFWVEVPEDVARSKVGHCFRDQFRKLSKETSSRSTSSLSASSSSNSRSKFQQHLNER